MSLAKDLDTLLAYRTETAEPKFPVGARVEKVKGYKWPGVIVARFQNLAGQTRYVVECTVSEVAGALHIYSEEQLCEP